MYLGPSAEWKHSTTVQGTARVQQTRNPMPCVSTVNLNPEGDLAEDAQDMRLNNGLKGQSYAPLPRDALFTGHSLGFYGRYLGDSLCQSTPRTFEVLGDCVLDPSLDPTLSIECFRDNLGTSVLSGVTAGVDGGNTVLAPAKYNVPRPMRLSCSEEIQGPSEADRQVSPALTSTVKDPCEVNTMSYVNVESMMRVQDSADAVEVLTRRLDALDTRWETEIAKHHLARLLAEEALEASQRKMGLMELRISGLESALRLAVIAGSGPNNNAQILEKVDELSQQVYSMNDRLTATVQQTCEDRMAAQTVCWEMKHGQQKLIADVATELKKILENVSTVQEEIEVFRAAVPPRAGPHSPAQSTLSCNMNESSAGRELKSIV